MGSFDIRTALTERNYVTTNVPFWVDDKVFYDLQSVRDQHARAIEDAEIKALDERLDQLEKRRDDEAYHIYLRSISNRANEDIISKALAEWPIKRDIYGREDENEQMERGKLIREMQVAAHIVKIVNPEGVGQSIDDDDRRDVARAILAEAPPVSLNVLDQAIAELQKDFKDETLRHQDTDFLSKH